MAMSALLAIPSRLAQSGEVGSRFFLTRTTEAVCAQQLGSRLIYGGLEETAYVLDDSCVGEFIREYDDGAHA
jgi:hypothetical protein